MVKSSQNWIWPPLALSSIVYLFLQGLSYGDIACTWQKNRFPRELSLFTVVGEGSEDIKKIEQNISTALHWGRKNSKPLPKK